MGGYYEMSATLFFRGFYRVNKIVIRRRALLLGLLLSLLTIGKKGLIRS